MPDSPTDYNLLSRQMDALLRDEHDPIANMANFSSVVFSGLTDINWAGFYRLKNGELILGPFQGAPGCVHIILGSGVCGTAAAKRKTLIVANVDAFPGHIACDAASKSEIVVPMIDTYGQLIGVFDVDSPVRDRFSERDKTGLEELLKILLKHTNVKGQR